MNPPKVKDTESAKSQQPPPKSKIRGVVFFFQSAHQRVFFHDSAQKKGGVCFLTPQKVKKTCRVLAASGRVEASFEIGWRQKFAMGQRRYCAALRGAIDSDLPSAEQLARRGPRDPGSISRKELGTSQKTHWFGGKPHANHGKLGDSLVLELRKSNWLILWRTNLLEGTKGGWPEKYRIGGSLKDCGWTQTLGLCPIS